MSRSSAVSPLVGRYARYKASGAEVLTWLAQTASHFCDLTQEIRALRYASSPPDADSVVSLSTTEISNLARLITEVRPHIQVPTRIRVALADAIEGRKLSAELYAEISMTEQGCLSDTDRSHRHFIQVLENVHELLETACHASPESTGSSRLNPAATAAEPLRDVDPTCAVATRPTQPEPSQSAKTGWHNLEAIVGETAAGLGLADIKFAAEEGHDDDLTFKLWCHLEDLRAVRKWVLDTFRLHKKGETSFLAACMAANVAIQLLKCAHAPFALMHPELEHYDQVMHFLGLEVTTDWRNPVIYIAKASESSLSAHAVRDIPDSVCAAGAMLVELYHSTLSRICTNHSNRQNGRARERAPPDIDWPTFHPFAKVLLDHAWAMHNLAPHLSYFQQDEFAAGLSEGRIPLWLAAACQMCMDICDIVGHDSSRGVAGIKNGLLQWVECNKIEPELITLLPRDMTQAVITREAPADAQRAQKLLTSNISAWCSGDVDSASFAAQEKTVKRLRNHFVTGLETPLPLHSGATVLDIKTAVLEKSCSITQKGKVMQCVASMYRAARETGLLECDWEDMEFFIASQVSTCQLVPEFPKNCRLDQMQYHFEATIGVNVDYYIRRGEWLDAKPLTTGETIGVGATLIATLQKLAREYAPDPAGGERQGTLPRSKVVEIVLHKMASEALKQEPALLARACTEQEQFTPVELLEVFQDKFEQEEPILNFDQVKLWQQCKDLLEVMLREAHKTLEQKYFTTGTTTPWMLTWKVLRELGDFSHNTLHETVLAKLAAVMKEHIQAVGSDLKKDAYDQSSGSLADEFKWSGVVEPQRIIAANETLPLQHFGASIACTGNLLTVYHPKLTPENVQNALAHMQNEKKSKCIGIPCVLLEDEEQHEAHGGDADPQLRVWKLAPEIWGGK